MVCIKICKTCNNEFVARSNRQLICDDCKTAAKVLKPIKCKWCGDEFVPKHKSVKYCSDDCKVLAKLKYDRNYIKIINKMKANVGNISLPLFKPNFKKEAKIIKQLKKNTFKGKKNTKNTDLDNDVFYFEQEVGSVDYDKELVIDSVEEFFLENTPVDLDNNSKLDMEAYASWVLDNSEY